MRVFPPLLCCLVLALAGCSRHVAQVRGVAPLNRNAEGESTPDDVRFYLLAGDNAFARASFAALWTDPTSALGAELLGPPTVVTVLPGAAVDAAQVVALSGSTASWVGVQLLVRREGDLPRTLLIPVDRLGSSVIEATGYGLRLAERR